jgi:hypothetical protein
MHWESIRTQLTFLASHVRPLFLPVRSLTGCLPDARRLFCVMLILPRTTLRTLTLCVLLVTAGRRASAQQVDFRRDIVPILQQKCIGCHNRRDPRGGLSLQSADEARRGGESGPVIAAGDPESSILLHLITPLDGAAEMPKDERPLEAHEVATIRRWIAEGAKWPPEVVIEPEVAWSLKPLVRPEVPRVTAVRSEFRIRNPIDAFIAARHTTAQLVAAPEADRRTLIRRLSLDLTGLPPSQREVVAFCSDDSAEAYETLVDALLKSPHFGERWGRHWLDLARYADSEGYLGDALRPHAWVFREWVINAINSDMPFDQFTIEQLAGDLLEDRTAEQKIATGFHRNTLRNTEAGVDLELYRTKEIVDRVKTTGMVWLGLTLGCAECHDHKHDPVSQPEFYRLYAFFNNADEIGVPVTIPWEAAEYENALKRWQHSWTALVTRLEQYQNDNLNHEQSSVLTSALADNGKTFQWKTIEKFYRTEQPGWSTLRTQIDGHLKQKPIRPATRARAFARRTKDRRETHVHIRGVYSRQGDRVFPDTPSILPNLGIHGREADRLDLARWLFHKDNPLTARVAANRIWQHLFGKGLVATPNDFGMKGAPPTHPQLLDWLATEYRRLGWSRKQLIRLIVTSSTYRLSSAVKAVPAQESVSNQLLWRQNSYRVNAEIIRDLHLAASGLLDRTI